MRRIFTGELKVSTTYGVGEENEVKKSSQWRDVWHRFIRNKKALLCLMVIIILVIFAVFAPILAPFGYDDQDSSRQLELPSKEHFFGTDEYGRDIFSRIIYGSRTSLSVGLISVSISSIIGTIIGAMAEVCEKAAIMYAGEMVEFGTVEHIYNETKHPYTKGLFESIPNFEENVRRLEPIRGLMPDPSNLPIGCTFAPRCLGATQACLEGNIPMVEVSLGHFVQCIHVEVEKI